MSRESQVAVLVQRVGPYHHARFDAWARSRAGAVNVIEFRPEDPVYAWAPVQASGTYGRFSSCGPEQLTGLLDQLRPQAVVCVGYADPEVHQAVGWAVRQGVPLVTCSDSTYADEPRSGFKETLKRTVLGSFDAALAAGTRSRDYLRHLGLPEERVFQPWDVVDNRHFAEGAAAARGNISAMRERWSLPERYFLCVARFVPKKNLEVLIAAYGAYASRVGKKAWALVLSGDGPLQSRLRAAADATGHGATIHFPGFIQYPDLPVFYGLAGAFVLPSLSDQWGLVVNEAMAAGLPVLVSKRCGCVPDLVRAGSNGFSFEPEDVRSLATRLETTGLWSDEQRFAMGRRSQEIVAAYSPEQFALGVETAVACVLQRRERRPPWLARWMSGRLAKRRVPV